MPRVPTVRLRRRADGFEMTVNAGDYAADLARWRGWRRVGEARGEPQAPPAETPPDHAAMTWPELRQAVRAATGKTPRSRRAALAALSERED